MFLELHAYQYHVFLDFRVVQDDEWQSYRHLYDYLGGRGVPDVGEALRELLLQPVLNPFREIAHPGYLQYLLDNRLDKENTSLPEPLLDEAVGKMENLVKGVQYLSGYAGRTENLLTEVRSRLETLLSIQRLEHKFPVPGSRAYPAAIEYIRAGLEEKPLRWYILFGWIFIHNLGKTGSIEDYENQALTWIEEWQFGKVLVESLKTLGVEESEAWQAVDVIRLLTGQQSWYLRVGSQSLDVILEEWLADSTVRRFLGINRFKDVLWFNKEALEEFVWWMTLVNMLEASGGTRKTSTRFVEQVLGAYEIAQNILRAEKSSAYQVNKLLKAVKGL
jgi:hypothetical protein